MRLLSTISVCLFFVFCVLPARASLGISNLWAIYQQGQVFLTWDEIEQKGNIYYNIYKYDEPITAKNIKMAKQIGHHVEPYSACDWWLDPASFDKNAKPDRSHGFIIGPQRLLNPASGLFVHTVCAGDEKGVYFAVTTVTNEKEDFSIVLGKNSLKKPVIVKSGLPMPIQLGNTLPAGAAKGQSLTIRLHGRGGDLKLSHKSNFLLFGDSTMGWREGLARKFFVYKKQDGIVIEPYDRLWVGRPLDYSPDERDHVRAINTWWYGCNNFIYDTQKVKNGVVINYTERYILYLVKWAQQYFGTDPAQTNLEGNSMGATGALSIGLHHPEVFTSIFATVPLPAYTRKSDTDGKTTIGRLDGICGRICEETIITNEGISVLDRMNSEKLIANSIKELPFIVVLNGRTDKSMPWINNPSFYRQMNASRVGFVAYWNNGGHDMYHEAPQDMLNYFQLHHCMALNKSYPAFSNFSENKDPGNGNKDDGDLTGWMNRGLYWENIQDTKEKWSTEIYLKDTASAQKVSADLTPRRLQNFRVVKGRNYAVKVGNTTGYVMADEKGLITIRNIVFESNKRITVIIAQK